MRIIMNRTLAAAFVLSLSAAPVMAGPVADFDKIYDTAYASYRTALFATNSGDAGKSSGALTKLDTNWADLMAQYRVSPPPQFEADPLWTQSIEEVTALLLKAKEQVAAGTLPEAHLTLEGIRDTLGSLHARNHIETYSDRMNAYHAEMEAILDIDMGNLDAASKQRLLEHAAVLAYLASDVVSAPPITAADNVEYAALSAAMQLSVDRFMAAARLGDDAAISAAVAGLKVPYSKLFLKFG